MPAQRQCSTDHERSERSSHSSLTEPIISNSSRIGQIFCFI